MQAIETRYIGPSNVKGARIVARCDAKRIIVGWDHSLNSEDNHRAAARKLILQLGWHGRWVSGAIPSLPSGYVHVNVQRYEDDWKGPNEGFDVWRDLDKAA